MVSFYSAFLTINLQLDLCVCVYIYTIVLINYDGSDGQAKIAKEIIEDIDDVNLSTTFKVIEGDLMKEYKDFRLIVQATPKQGGGTLVHWTLEYEKRKAHTPDPHTLLQLDIDMTKQVDDHLAAQPNNRQATTAETLEAGIGGRASIWSGSST